LPTSSAGGSISFLTFLDTPRIPPTPERPPTQFKEGRLLLVTACCVLRGLGLVPEREAFLEAEKRVPAGLLMEAVGTEGTKENRPGTLYASDMEHELIPTSEWKPGEEVRPKLANVLVS